MSTMDINKGEYEDENKSPDKKQIEAEEKEVMLKSDNEVIEALSEKIENEGPVKAALGDVTEEGREVKPKFIPIGAIKMPGFFTRNGDKDKSKDEDGAIEKDIDPQKSEENSKPKIHHRLQFLHSCPLTKFLHHPKNETGENGERKRGIFNIKYPKLFQKRSERSAEAALASMETLDEKLDSPSDGMEIVKLEPEPEEGKVATKLPLKERIRQKKFETVDILIFCVGLLMLLVLIIGIIIGAQAGPPKERPLRLGRFITTVTGCGPVEGIYDEGVFKFFSIPFAVPPIDEKRFTYAQPLNNVSLCWNGTYIAHKQAHLCAQFLENGTIVGDEDCLTLDVVTPHVRYDSSLPVVVLVGANSFGGGIGPAQPSALYARTKEVVFVRPNFRLGAFGFLALDVLSESEYPRTSGNYGLSDLVAALQWIKLNIKHFGGDPESVTLLGHRAGATLAAALTTVHNAHKLYSRAWLSSPSVVFPDVPLDVAQKNNEQFKQISRCEDAACLRRKSTIDMMSVTPDIWLGDSLGKLPVAGEFNHTWLVLDGILLRVHANLSWAAQKKDKEAGKDKLFKPMVFGTTQHSAHSEQLHGKHLNWTADIVEETINASVLMEKNLTSVYSHFNKTYEGLVSLMSSIRTLCPLVQLARSYLGVPMYVVSGAGAGGGARGERLAGVDADVEAILGTFDSEVPEQRRFMAAMQHLFYYYVWNGRLPGSDSGLISVGQDALPLAAAPPACDLLVQNDIVPQYAHVD